MPSDDGTNTIGRSRSKAGCLTCRQRRKKCDETHLPDHGGACQRCFQGAWRCEWPTPPGAAPVRVFERGAKIRAKHERVVSMLTESSQSAASAGIATSSSSPSVLSGTFATNSPFQAVSSPSVPASTATASVLMPSFQFVAPPALEVESTRSVPAPLPAPGSSTAPGYLSQHLALSPFHPPVLGHNVSALASSPANGAPASDDFWQSVDSHFAAGPISSSALTAAHEGPATTQADRHELLDPAYDIFIEAHLYALAKPLRDSVVREIRNFVQSTEVCRHAALASTILLRLNILRDSSRHPSSQAVPGEDEDEIQKLRAKADEYYRRGLEHISQQSYPLVVKILALWDLWLHQFITVGAEAASFLLLLGDVFALELGTRPAIHHAPNLTPEQVIITMSAWEDCIRCATSPRRRPFFSFSDLPGDPISPSSPALRDDVNDVISELPVIGYMPVGLMLCIAAIANLSVDMDALPDAVIKAKASAIERAVRGWRPLPPINDIDSAAFVEQTATCEMWRHAIIIYLFQVIHRHGPMSGVLASATQQILRIGTPLIGRAQPGRNADLLATLTPPADSPADPEMSVGYQSGPTSAADATSDTSATSAVIALLAPNARAVPFFLAGTCAMTPLERRMCVAGIQAGGDVRGYLDDVHALQTVWDRQRRDGWPRPWRDVLQEEKLHVVFV